MSTSAECLDGRVRQRDPSEKPPELALAARQSQKAPYS